MVVWARVLGKKEETVEVSNFWVSFEFLGFFFSNFWVSGEGCLVAGKIFLGKKNWGKKTFIQLV